MNSGREKNSAVAQINVRPLLVYLAKLIVEDSRKKSEAEQCTKDGTVVSMATAKQGAS